MSAPYYEDDLVTLYHGDSRAIIPTLTGIDAVDEAYCEIAARRLAQDTLFGEIA